MRKREKTNARWYGVGKIAENFMMQEKKPPKGGFFMTGKAMQGFWFKRHYMFFTQASRNHDRAGREKKVS